MHLLFAYTTIHICFYLLNQITSGVLETSFSSVMILDTKTTYVYVQLFSLSSYQTNFKLYSDLQKKYEHNQLAEIFLLLKCSHTFYHCKLWFQNNRIAMECIL